MQLVINDLNGLLITLRRNLRSINVTTKEVITILLQNGIFHEFLELDDNDCNLVLAVQSRPLTQYIQT